MRLRNTLRRPRLQYGLRSLLVVMSMACVVLGWYVERIRRQQRAVAALISDGAKIYYYDDTSAYFESNDFLGGKTVKSPRSFVERVEYLTPVRIRTALGIDFFRRVNRVDCGYYSEFPRDPCWLRDLSGLQDLESYHALDDDLATIGALSELTQLTLCESVISDAGLVHLAELHKLEYLDLGYHHDRISSLSHLPITDDGLVCLAGLRRLKYLDLSGSSIRGEGLRHLTGLTELEDLNLGETKLTDAALPYLAQFPRLKRLDIHGTAVTTWLAEQMLPHTEITRHDINKPLTHGQELTHVGRWKDALDALHEENAWWLPSDGSTTDGKQYDGSAKAASIDGDPYSPRGQALFDIGRCRAELGQVREAAGAFCQLLDWIHALPSPRMGGIGDGDVWRDIYEWPEVFERVGRARPNDVARWITSAERAVLDARWSDAADHYSRAAEFPGFGNWTWVPSEYALSRIVMRKLDDHERLCAQIEESSRRMLEAWGSGVQEQTPSEDEWPASIRLRLVVPQGSAAASQLALWCRHEPSDDEKPLLPLLYCRAGKFEQVLHEDLPWYRLDLGRYWFCRAMAHHHLKQAAEARVDYARGVRWLDRHLREDRILGNQHDVEYYLEAEALRREAGRLIESLGN
ncbi:MAG TPA: hypothetical protein VF278_22595 [Pirellulales bacterium]